jgi:hypothetical protein
LTVRLGEPGVEPLEAGAACTGGFGEAVRDEGR